MTLLCVTSESYDINVHTMLLRIPHQFGFFARLISDSFPEKSNLSDIDIDMLADLYKCII